MVFCDGKPLVQVALYRQMTEQPGSYWVEANGQTIHFRLENDEDPRMHTIELTCREQCFAPEIPFLSYIHVKGITCAHAAMGAPVPHVELFHACAVIIGLLRTAQLTGQMQLELILEMNAGIMIFYRINKSDTQLLEDVISRMLVFAELQDYLQSMCL